MRTRTLLLMIFSVMALALAMTSAAQAKGRDVNRDRIPDRWERHFHLSLHVNQAKRDQDKDGVNNRKEFRVGTSPRDADTDDDGISDDNENSGTIVSFTNGILTINDVNGDPVSAAVTDSTEIECGDRQEIENEIEHPDGGDSATTSSNDSGDGHGDNSGPGSTGEDNSGPGGQGEDSHSPGDSTNGGSGDQGQLCTQADLVPGTVVHEAELKLTSGGAVWEKVELVK